MQLTECEKHDVWGKKMSTMKLSKTLKINAFEATILPLICIAMNCCLVPFGK